MRLTREVYVARPLDREAIDKYELTILATDGKFVAFTALFIDILDVNGMLAIYFIFIAIIVIFVK